MKRLLIVAPNFWPRIGGVETHLATLVPHLVALGWTVSLFTWHLPGSPLREIFAGATIRRFGCSACIRGRREGYVQMIRECEREEFDLLYLVLSVGELYPSDLMLRIVERAKVRDAAALVRVTSTGRVRELAARYPESLSLLGLVDGFVALNEEIEQELLAFGVPDGRIRRLGTGVDVGRFVPMGRPPGADAPWMWVSVSRRDPKKRLDLLEAAWHYYRKLAGSVAASDRLRLIGGDDGATGYRSGVEKPPADDGQGIVRVGSVNHSDVSELLASAHVSLSLSLQEGLSNALLESLACGVPVAAPATAATRELIGDEACWWALPDTASPETIAASLLNIRLTSSEELEEMRQRARRRALARFDAANMASDLDAYMRALAAREAAA